MTADPRNRSRLERLIGNDLQGLTTASDQICRTFASEIGVNGNDLRALLFVMVAEASARDMTAGELRQAMGLSGAAITYLVERLTEAGHLRREADPADRRKVILRHGYRFMEVADAFFRAAG